ncbi:17662_t:CDS:2 [Gigaspora rosea]|nr:17662_t:CDS:2 [Gigaspora rosea]
MKMGGATTIKGQKVNHNHVTLHDGEKVEFYKHLYLDHIIGCEGVESIIFGVISTYESLEEWIYRHCEPKEVYSSDVYILIEHCIYLSVCVIDSLE